MANDENTVALTESENAFFESGGETAVEPEKVVEPEVVEPSQEQARDEKGKFIPHAVFHAEREEHKKTKTQLEEISRKQAILEDRWNTLLTASKPEKTDDDPAPDPNEDIFAFSAWQKRQMDKLNQRVSEREQQEQQATEAQRQENAIWGEWQQSSAAYAQEKTDFNDARNFLAELRDKQLAGLARVHPQFATKQGRDAQINAELKAIIIAAKQQNVSPAEAVYEMAGAWGYAPKGAEEVVDPGKLELSEKLGKVQSAMEASKTIGATNARAGADALSAQAIADMPAHEFEAWMKNPDNARRFRTMMGG